MGVESSGLYFEASAVIITLVLLGKYLEMRAKGKTAEAIIKLMGLQPKNASVERNGSVVVIPISDVLPGDIVHVKPGERIPVADSIKDNSSEGISLLKELGLDVFMITGDNYRTAKAIAQKAGIENILAEVMPEGKAYKAGKLQEKGRVVAMGFLNPMEVVNIATIIKVEEVKAAVTAAGYVPV